MSDTTTDTRTMAGVRDTTGAPILRDEYAAALTKEASPHRGEQVVRVNAGEATVIAELLDELAAVYPGEAIGVVARSMAIVLYDRLGI